MLAIQGFGYRELPSSGGNPDLPFKKESIMVVKKMLAETLKSMSMYGSAFDSTARKRPIMGAPMLDQGAVPAPEEEFKEDPTDPAEPYKNYQQWLQQMTRSDGKKDPMSDDPDPLARLEPSVNASPNLRASPIPQSVLLSPLGSVRNNPEANMSEPNYFQRFDPQQQNNMSLQEYRNPFDFFENAAGQSGYRPGEYENGEGRRREGAEVETLNSQSEGRRTPERNGSSAAAAGHSHGCGKNNEGGQSPLREQQKQAVGKADADK